MPASASPAKDDARENKIFGRHKWRGKLFSSDRKDEKQAEDQQSKEQDIAHFLGSRSRGDEDRLLDAPSASGLDRRDASGQPSGDEGSLPPPPTNIYHGAKPKQNKGLHVRFVTTTPQIIGEGGDEADTPSNLVSAMKYNIPDLTLSLQTSQESDAPTLPEVPVKPLSSLESLPNDRSPSLRASLQAQRLRRRPVQDIGDVHPISLQGKRSIRDDISVLGSTLSLLSKEDEADGGLSQAGKHEDASYLRPISPNETHCAGNSLTPRASPEPNAFFQDVQDPSYLNPRPSSRECSQSDGSLLNSSRPRPGHSSSTAETEPKPKSLRKVAKALGPDAIDEFDAKVSRFHELFRLGVTVHQEIMDVSFQRWLRTATWWFLKGRAELELDVRRQSREANNDIDHMPSQRSISSGLKQAYVNLAKACWIVKSITPNHPEIRRYGNTSVKSMVAILRNFGNGYLADLAQNHVDIVANLRALAMSMKRNDWLPPADLEIQRLDVRVFFDEVKLPVEANTVMKSGRHCIREKIHCHSMPLGDSAKYFTFSRLFGSGSVTSRSRSWEPLSVPCVVTLLRLRDTLDLTALLCSQDESIDLSIQAEETSGSVITWKDVNWSNTGNFITVNVSQETDLVVLLSEHDFKALWTICDYTRKVQKDFYGRRGEEMAFEATLHSFQCLRSTQHASSFPLDPISHCKMRLFNLVKESGDGTGRLRAGSRLMAKTPPDIKSLSSISQKYGEDMPTLFGFSKREDQPRLSVRVPGSSTFVLTFITREELDRFYNVFTQRQPTDEETRSSSLSLQGLTIVTEDQNTNSKTQHLQKILWQQVKVITRRPPTINVTPTIDRSQHLRLITQCDAGIVTDCMAMAPGELEMNLSVHDCNEISLRRPPQRDLFVSLIDHSLKKEEIGPWRGMIWAAGRSVVTRSFQFRALADLHVFEALVLGFDVAYEGLASHFAISRRRKGLPVHKQWEADFARMQILKQDRNVQLVVFFKDFSHGSSMNFVLKSTDVFEKSVKANEHHIRIVDAKFALPRGPEDPARDFVSLDMPEYPGEHDDITICFHDERERDKFANQLPAAISKASRLASLKR